MRYFFLLACWAFAVVVQAQSQRDARGLLSLNLEKKVTQSLSFTGMAAAIQLNNFREPGFIWLDAGVKYRLSRHLGVNVNYRPIWSRRLNNSWRLRHLLYADLDAGGSAGRFAWGATARFQASGFAEFAETGGSWLNRTKVNLRYRIDYYWQPFVETELFTPFPFSTWRPTQWRCSVGSAFTFNRNVRVELYVQVQQQINVPAENTNLLTALNWTYRF